MSQKRKGISKPRHKPFFQEYNFEITVLLLISLGIFLLVEEMEIKHYIYVIIRSILFSIGNFIKTLRDGTIFLIDKFEVSDIVGISLIIFALLLIANRWRERMIERYSILKKCPKCSSELKRIRRKLKHKITGFIYFVNVKNYHCKECDYNGIKMMKN